MATDRNPSPDFAILVMGVARTISDRLNHAVATTGIEDMRPPFGFVIRALVTRDRTLTELAQLLDVTKQAAIKVVDEMEARGYVERTADPGDGRAKRLKLTHKAERVRQIALATSAEMEAELRYQVGAENAQVMRETLIAFLEANGGVADAMAGRSRAVW